MAQCAQVSGHAQPEHVDGINFGFENLDALFDWEQGGKLPQPSPDPLFGQDSVRMSIPMHKEIINIYPRILTGLPQ